MKNSRPLVLILSIIVIASAFSVFLTGCGKNVKKNILPPDVYYKKALFDSQNHNYSGAAKNFKALIENYPSYHNTKKAELKLGDAYYLEGKYIEAQGAYLDFIHLHPRSRYTPFAMFYEAMSFYKRKESPGRTQSPLKSAKTTFEKLISRYPYSKYSKKSFKYIKLIDIKLSENTFFTGLYYYNASLWKPAAYMFKTVLGQYESKGVPVIPKTLYYLAVCYKHLNNKQMETHYMNILRTKYPQSKYAR
ncbi:MAG: outer membrane protein assembly factor BamD [bacterium]